MTAARRVHHGNNRMRQDGQARHFSVLGKDGKDKAVRGTVSYIHPARRYCILEFAVRGGILRESFQLIDGEIAE